MPVLALGGPATILSTNTSTATPVRIAPPATPNAGPVVTPNSLSGFIRPEFVLGYDETHLDSSTDAWGLERVGEDLVSNNVLGFDVQIFDPNASFFEMSTGVIVGPNDAGYREALRAAITGLAASPPTVSRSQGGFVDLAYPVLAGGSLRGWQARRIDRRSATDDPAISSSGSYLITPFSGIANYNPPNPMPPPIPATSRNAYQPALYKSGRVVTSGTSIRLFQPTFDTFTSFYERDGFQQGPVSGSVGTLWSTTTTTTSTVTVDQAGDGLDNDQAFGVDDAGERETLPPFRARPEAIRVTVRLTNPAIRLIRQASADYRDQL